MNKYLDVAPEVAEALAAGKPVVALESTIISHGMPYPQNVETALKVEQIIRDAGAVPATIAIIGGRLKAGLSKEEIDYLGRTGAGIPKASRRDLPVLVAQGKDGACTVTTTMMIADMAGIRVFATGLARVFISLGADGVLAADHEHKLHLHNPPARMVNTTGCGDAFMAAAARSFLDGNDLETAAKRGLAASAVAMESADTINPAMSLAALAERIQ